MDEKQTKNPEVIEYSPVELPNTRFCGRCQRWVPRAVDIHFCVKAPRKIGYAWYEPDVPALEKNAILQDGRKFKRGKLIAEFPAEE